MNVSSISVLICTFNRAELLRETLAAVHEMDPPDACAVQIIVVDNNSTDETPQVITESMENARFPVVLVRERKQGKSFALNAGLAAATGDVLALTDDDVLPARDWLARIVRAFRTQNVTFVFGKVLPRWQSQPPPELLTPQAQAIWGPMAIVDYGDAPVLYTPTSRGQRLPIGANLAVLRKVLVSIGGWRTDLGKVNNTLICGEDHEIFMRLRRCGCYSGYYDPQIVVRHLVPTHRLTRRYFRKWFYWHGKTTALMLNDLYPELDMAVVPRVAGAPRFKYRQGIRQIVRWAATRRADPLTALIEELNVCHYLGLFVECWHRRKQAISQFAASFLTAASVVAALPVDAATPRLQVTFDTGRVSIVAHGVTVQQVLEEWARVGRTVVDHAEAAPAAVIDIELDGVAEEEALDVLLRSAPGFIASPAPTVGPAASRFGRIVIVAPGDSQPDTWRPAPSAQAPTPYVPPVQPTIVQRLIGADGRPVPDDQEGAPAPGATQ